MNRTVTIKLQMKKDDQSKVEMIVTHAETYAGPGGADEGHSAKTSTTFESDSQTFMGTRSAVTEWFDRMHEDAERNAPPIPVPTLRRSRKTDEAEDDRGDQVLEEVAKRVNAGELDGDGVKATATVHRARS